MQEYSREVIKLNRKWGIIMGSKLTKSMADYELTSEANINTAIGRENLKELCKTLDISYEDMKKLIHRMGIENAISYASRNKIHSGLVYSLAERKKIIEYVNKYAPKFGLRYKLTESDSDDTLRVALDNVKYEVQEYNEKVRRAKKAKDEELGNKTRKLREEIIEFIDKNPKYYEAIFRANPVYCDNIGYSASLAVNDIVKSNYKIYKARFDSVVGSLNNEVLHEGYIGYKDVLRTLNTRLGMNEKELPFNDFINNLHPFNLTVNNILAILYLDKPYYNFNNFNRLNAELSLTMRITKDDTVNSIIQKLNTLDTGRIEKMTYSYLLARVTEHCKLKDKRVFGILCRSMNDKSYSFIDYAINYINSNYIDKQNIEVKKIDEEYKTKFRNKGVYWSSILRACNHRDTKRKILSANCIASILYNGKYTDAELNILSTEFYKG